MHKHILKHGHLALLTLPALLLSACGDELDTGEGSVTERASLTRLELVGEQDTYLLHPVKVAIAAELDSEAFETEALVGLRTADHTEGCVLGSIAVEHAEDGQAQLEKQVEFQIDPSCYELVGRDDVELFLSFDPWNRLGDRDSLVGDGDSDLFTLVESQSLDHSACETCGASVRVHESPGFDPKLRSLTLGSTVAVLADADADAPLGAPDFMMSSELLVAGLSERKGVDDGTVSMRYTLRPLGSNADGLPLLVNHQGELDELSPISVPGYTTIHKIDALHIQDAAREALLFGEWAGIEEFELVSCVTTSVEQARYADGLDGTANDCAAMPVVVVREQVDDGSEGASLASFAAVYANHWGSNNSTFGETSVDFEAWVDAGATDSGATTYSGVELSGYGAWFDAGVRSIATVFDYGLTLVDIYAIFAASQSGGTAAMKGQFLIWDFLPEFEVNLGPGKKLSLQDVLDATGSDLKPSIQESVALFGYDFDDGCGNVTAAISLQGTLGINTDETWVTFYTDPVKVVTTVTPYANIAAVAETSVSYGEYLSGGVAITVDVINIDVPFVTTATLDTASNPDKAVFTNTASMSLSTLGGAVTYWIKYDVFLGLITDTHEGTLLSWNGIDLGTFQLFNVVKSLNLGSGASGASPSALAQIQAGGSSAVWRIKETRWGHCLDLDQGKTANHTAIQTWSCNTSTDHQMFRFQPYGDYYRIIHDASGKCVTVEGGSMDEGARFILYNCNSGYNQQFTLASNGYTSDETDFVMRVRSSGKCLDNGNSSANGTDTLQWTCHSNYLNQNWAIHSRVN